MENKHTCDSNCSDCCSGASSYFDCRLITSVATGIILAMLVVWIAGIIVHGFGFGYGKRWDGDRGMMRGEMMQGRGMMYDDRGGNPAGTYEEGTPIPEGAPVEAQ